MRHRDQMNVEELLAFCLQAPQHDGLEGRYLFVDDVDDRLGFAVAGKVVCYLDSDQERQLLAALQRRAAARGDRGQGERADQNG